MSDELDVNPDAPDAAPAEAKPDFSAHELHDAMTKYIEEAGGYASGRLHQLLAEMRALFNL